MNGHDYFYLDEYCFIYIDDKTIYVPISSEIDHNDLTNFSGAFDPDQSDENIDLLNDVDKKYKQYISNYNLACCVNELNYSKQTHTRIMIGLHDSSITTNFYILSIHPKGLNINNVTNKVQTLFNSREPYYFANSVHYDSKYGINSEYYKQVCFLCENKINEFELCNMQIGLYKSYFGWYHCKSCLSDAQKIIKQFKLSAGWYSKTDNELNKKIDEYLCGKQCKIKFMNNNEYNCWYICPFSDNYYKSDGNVYIECEISNEIDFDPTQMLSNASKKVRRDILSLEDYVEYYDCCFEQYFCEISVRKYSFAKYNNENNNCKYLTTTINMELLMSWQQ